MKIKIFKPTVYNLFRPSSVTHGIYSVHTLYIHCTVYIPWVTNDGSGWPGSLLVEEAGYFGFKQDKVLKTFDNGQH
jgi:hypothetical protein